MQIRTVTPVLGRTLVESIGHSVANTIRSGAGIFKTIRGDSRDVTVEGAAPTNYANLAVYGTLAALAFVVVLKKGTR